MVTPTLAARLEAQEDRVAKLLERTRRNLGEAQLSSRAARARAAVARQLALEAARRAARA